MNFIAFLSCVNSNIQCIWDKLRIREIFKLKMQKTINESYKSKNNLIYFSDPCGYCLGIELSNGWRQWSDSDGYWFRCRFKTCAPSLASGSQGTIFSFIWQDAKTRTSVFFGSLFVYFAISANLKRVIRTLHLEQTSNIFPA